MEKTSQSIYLLSHNNAKLDQMKKWSSNCAHCKIRQVSTNLLDFEKSIVQNQPDIALLEYDIDDKSSSDLIVRLNRSVPNTAIMVISDNLESGSILTAMKLGVKEYFSPSTTQAEFDDAILRIARKKYLSSKTSGKLISVFGAKGGVGSSLIVANLAYILSQKMGQRVALMDLVFSRGDLTSMFNLKPIQDISSVPSNFDKIDSVFTDGLLTEVFEGLRLLPAPDDPALGDSVNVEHVEKVIDYLLDSHTYVVVDMPNNLGEKEVLVLDKSSYIILVIEPTVLCLRSAKRIIELCDRIGYSKDKIVLIVNRYGSKNTIQIKDIERTLNKRVAAFLPNESEIVMKASDLGVPVCRDWPKSQLSKKLTDFSKYILDQS